MKILEEIRKKLSCGFWNIGLLDCSIDKILEGEKNYTIKWMKHNFLDCFFADPFPIASDNYFYYILAEEYNYHSSKGIIVKLKISKNDFQLIDREKIIETDFHLSFPFPYKGMIVPEQFRSGKLFAYKNKSEKCICDYPVIDPTLFEYNGEEFLIGNLVRKNNIEANTNLYLFKKIKENYELMDKSPIKSNIEGSRSAGKVFKYNGEMYRPVQDCKRIYGDRVRIMHLKSIGVDWHEEEICTVDSKNSDAFNEGLHTFNVWENIIIVDGFANQYRGYRKLGYLLDRYCKRLNCNERK